MVRVPGGTFMMGTSEDNAKRLIKQVPEKDKLIFRGTKTEFLRFSRALTP
jgi:hypothetical protein